MSLWSTLIRWWTPEAEAPSGPPPVAAPRSTRDDEPTEPIANDGPGRLAPSLLAAVAANPEDEGLLLVYGEELQQAGDPRGDLIAVQAELRQTSDVARRELLRDHEARILREARDHLVPMALRARLSGEVHWDLGFIRHLRLRPPVGAAVDRDAVRELLADPGLALLRTLHAEALGLGPGLLRELLDEAGHPKVRLLRGLADAPPPAPALDVEWRLGTGPTAGQGRLVIRSVPKDLAAWCQRAQSWEAWVRMTTPAGTWWFGTGPDEPADQGTPWIPLQPGMRTEVALELVAFHDGIHRIGLGGPVVVGDPAVLLPGALTGTPFEAPRWLERPWLTPCEARSPLPPAPPAWLDAHGPIHACHVAADGSVMVWATATRTGLELAAIDLRQQRLLHRWPLLAPEEGKDVGDAAVYCTDQSAWVLVGRKVRQFDLASGTVRATWVLAMPTVRAGLGRFSFHPGPARAAWVQGSFAAVSSEALVGWADRGSTRPGGVALAERQGHQGQVRLEDPGRRWRGDIAVAVLRDGRVVLLGRWLWLLDPDTEDLFRLLDGDLVDDRFLIDDSEGRPTIAGASGERWPLG